MTGPWRWRDCTTGAIHLELRHRAGCLPGAATPHSGWNAVARPFERDSCRSVNTRLIPEDGLFRQILFFRENGGLSALTRTNTTSAVPAIDPSRNREPSP